MTEWNDPDYTCDDCDAFDESCHNRNSDHYAHLLTPNHPACEHVVIVNKNMTKQTEYIHHALCPFNIGEECDCRDDDDAPNMKVVMCPADIFPVNDMDDCMDASCGYYRTCFRR